MTRINGRSIKVTDDSIIYDGRTYPIAGASAMYAERRQGIPLFTRRTVSEVTIMGRGWTIAGRVTSMGSARSGYARAGRKLVQQINTRAYVS